MRSTFSRRMFVLFLRQYAVPISFAHLLVSARAGADNLMNDSSGNASRIIGMFYCYIRLLEMGTKSASAFED